MLYENEGQELAETPGAGGLGNDELDEFKIACNYNYKVSCR